MTLGLAAIVLSTFPQGIDYGVNLEDALTDGDVTYVFLAPMLIGQGRSLAQSWSDDGRYLVMVMERQKLTPDDLEKSLTKGAAPSLSTEISLTIADFKKCSAKDIWTVSAPKGGQGTAAFFQGSDVALVTAGSADGKCYVLRATLGTSKVELVETLGAPGKVWPSIGDSLAAVSVESPPSVRFIGKAGGVYPRQRLSIASGVSFSKTGSAVVSAAKAPGKHLTVIPGGEERWVDGFPKFSAFDETFEAERVMIENPEITLPGSRLSIPMVVAHINGGDKPFTLAVNATASFVRKDAEQAILFSMGDFYYARPIAKLPTSIYLTIASREERVRLKDELTQIGKALSRFLRDKKRLPAKDELDAVLKRYLAYPEIGVGFVYLGETQVSASPATREAGYKPCRGGRMVLYQDGHVAFVAKSKEGPT